MTRRADRPTRDRPTRDTSKEKAAAPAREDEFTIDPNKEEGIRKLREHEGKDTFVAAVDAFRAEFGLPDNRFDLLQKIFETHPSATVRAEALDRMDAGVDSQADSTQQVFKTRVKLLQLTAREPELKKVALRIARARKY